ncbi:uncharacterized protein SOCE26_049750 [Sorangium cellulosum]|uniref:Uncharacterized protein n=2 Tax=Sorangium cellulosum TaxID=56 RepID=A0A2L0EW57_SORCE|nr:uncharacterized protein SOCE26_049750 [Sorangium cellulosum]
MSICLLAGVAAAEPPPKAKAPKAEGPRARFVVDFREGSKRAAGWIWKVGAGANANFIDNQDVVGQPTGSAVTVGLQFDGSAEYNHGSHEFRNLLTLGEGATRTPVIPEFVKSSDSLLAESVYLYHIIDWAGVFGRFSIQSSIFAGVDVRPAGFSYAITRPDGRVDSVGGAADGLNRLRLSDPFRPTLFKESAGVFARPVTSRVLNVEARLGVGVRETIGANQLVINDNPVRTPTVVEVRELSNFNQLGLEGVVGVWGGLAQKRVTYRVGVEVMAPLVHTDLTPAELAMIDPTRGEQPGTADLTNVEIFGKLSFKLIEWASLDYQFKAIRQPQLVDLFQIQNNLLLTFSYIATNEPPEEPAAPAAAPPNAPAAAPPPRVPQPPPPPERPASPPPPR